MAGSTAPGPNGSQTALDGNEAVDLQEIHFALRLFLFIFDFSKASVSEGLGMEDLRIFAKSRYLGPFEPRGRGSRERLMVLLERRNVPQGLPITMLRLKGMLSSKTIV